MMAKPSQTPAAIQTRNRRANLTPAQRDAEQVRRTQMRNLKPIKWVHKLLQKQGTRGNP
jgi:hypothetical protein